MTVAVFVAPYLLEATTRFVAAAAMLPGVRLGLVTTVPAEGLPPVLREHVVAHWRVNDALDPRQVAEAVQGLSNQLGRVERLVGALEQLQVPLAHVRETLGIEGMAVDTAMNVRDKARMKSKLRDAGIPCARHHLVTRSQDAVDFAEAVGFPLVAKPPAGLVILGDFPSPERLYATGTAYLRGLGHGRVRVVHGIDELQRDIGDLVVGAKLPQPGQASSTTYEGEGHITVRHPETEVVKAALRRILNGVRIELVESE